MTTQDELPSYFLGWHLRKAGLSETASRKASRISSGAGSPLGIVSTAHEAPAFVLKTLTRRRSLETHLSPTIAKQSTEDKPKVVCRFRAA